MFLHLGFMNMMRGVILADFNVDRALVLGLQTGAPAFHEVLHESARYDLVSVVVGTVHQLLSELHHTVGEGLTVLLCSWHHWHCFFIYICNMDDCLFILIELKIVLYFFYQRLCYLPQFNSSGSWHDMRDES